MDEDVEDVIKEVKVTAADLMPSYNQQLSVAAEPYKAAAVTFNVEQLSCITWNTQQVLDWFNKHKLDKYTTQ